MNENEYLARTVYGQLQAGSPLVLISVMSILGSTPRQGGTKMVVAADGTSYGTIGGSLMEAAAIRESRDILSTGKSRILSYELTGEDATSPGMICGGQAELLLEYLPATSDNIEFSRCWYDAILQGKEFYLLTHFKDGREDAPVLGHAILYPDGNIAGNSSITASDVDKLKPELHNISTNSVLPLGDAQVMVDRVRKLKTLYCFGAGHVAVPTAHIAARVGFRVVVLDDRPEFANEERFPDTHEIRVVEDLNNAFDGLEIDEDSFIVIVTRGHQYDLAVLERSLKTTAGYIGMISSRKKRDAIYEALIAMGVKKERLAQVHSPIGIDIGGETPEEIALSIVAELVSERSKQQA
jgi:xanthine dehydrogenase accessory factor